MNHETGEYILKKYGFDPAKPLFHGSRKIVLAPDLKKGRKNVDFGQGFYITQDEEMARQWACKKKTYEKDNSYTSYISVFRLKDADDLNIYRFGLTPEWLHFITICRGEAEGRVMTDGVDIIVGPTADDNMPDTLEKYFDGDINEEQAIRRLDLAGYGNQIAIKTDKALAHLKPETFYRIEGEEQVFYRKVRGKRMKRMSERLAEEERRGSGFDKRPDTVDIRIKDNEKTYFHRTESEAPKAQISVDSEDVPAAAGGRGEEEEYYDGR